MNSTQSSLPLQDMRVVEFSHMVMGPSAGLMLADLGADVVKIEPIGGDKTRFLRGSGAGYFPMYNRNKRSVCLDLKSASRVRIASNLIETADVMIENFRPGAVDKLGFAYASLREKNPRLIYCSARGFLQGPYEKRTALDEVAQMMGGLAYMTGPPGRPLRAGASVIDVMGGTFAALAILAAVEERHRTGKGQHVESALFESTAFLMGQHMAQYAVTGTPAAPMPARVSAWAVYDVFETRDEQKLFVGVVSDSQWRTFCTAFGFESLWADPDLRENNARVGARDWIMPQVRQKFASLTSTELITILESSGLPFAPIATPQDLFDDEHLVASNGLLETRLSNDQVTLLPAMPVTMDGARPGIVRQPPLAGQHTVEVLTEMGLQQSEIDALIEAGVAA